MKSNKDENEPLKIEIEANWKRLKRFVAWFFYIDDIYFVSTEISLMCLYSRIRSMDELMWVTLHKIEVHKKIKI